MLFHSQDITRIVQSLSKTVKSTNMELELGPGQQADINSVLSVLEDFIRQHCKECEASANPPSKTKGSHNLIEPQLIGAAIFWNTGE